MQEDKKQEKTTKKVPCEIYTRVTGFYRPVSTFNKGKKEEYKDRKFYNPGC